MQDFIGSVCRSLVFKPSDDGGVFGGFVEKITSIIRKSGIGLFSKPPVPALPPIAKSAAIKVKKDDAPTIRWRKGELISCGSFGRVYMGLNIDSGALLAIKQVSIAGNSASKEKTQAHVRELEEEVNLLENLSHPNIVVIRMYTKQLLLGVEYLHRNGIMHRDIKGANILVDNKGCIKLADFGASKKVVELATMTGAKSMKGTPYWMAPEVILQTGHSLEPNLRPAASDLPQHPFVTREYQETYPVLRASVMENFGKKMATPEMELKNSMDPIIRTTYTRLKDVHNSIDDEDDLVIGASAKFDFALLSDDFNKGLEVDYSGSGNCDGDMCQIDVEDDLVIGASTKFDSALLFDDFNKSFNPMSKPDDNCACKAEDTPGSESRVNLYSGQTLNKPADIPRASAVNVACTASSGTYSQCVSNIGTESVQTLSQVQPPKPSEWKEVVRGDQELINPSASFYERKRIWEEELYEELERK
ncbi:Mitogen-activated protein kinase kinase kinase NPK1 [Camellia lanceoleosa]|uniref:Mitogen-activated protein kinase kinase kinase NPK1 n=1 Tax=Camellia lanceoleosa TaxID=1840588 RepID=A0ACC0GV48_9ERIC|nr:Mitogen-activated protein kinase kinase kinase NPK1 [Camellia lanceoleosa]